MHEQKFKDLLSSTGQVNVDRRVLDLESEVTRGLGSIPTRGNIFHWIFLFSRGKASAANIGIIAILLHFEKNSIINDRLLRCPAIYTDTATECYFVHRWKPPLALLGLGFPSTKILCDHTKECLIQQTSFSNWDTIFGNNC